MKNKGILFKKAVDFIAKTMYSIDMIKENNTLLNHIKSINKESKQWMKDNPGSWAGEVTEDIKYWNDQGIFTVADYERDSLITSVYEMHKDAFGVKGRHYNFKEMSNEDLEKELDTLSKIAKEEADRERKWEEAAYQTFLKTVANTIRHGAKDKEEAIRWILEAEELIKEEPDYICYKLGLSYDKAYLFETKQ